MLIRENFEGKQAVGFNFLDINGHIIRLGNYQGNWLLMVFHRHLG